MEHSRLLTLLSEERVSITAPTQLTGLVLWLDADDSASLFQDSLLTTPVTVTTDPVGGWTDKSGNSKHALQTTAGSRPLWTTGAAPNGKSGVRFDGIDDGFTGNGNPLSGGSIQATVFLCFKKIATAADRSPILFDNTTNNWLFFNSNRPTTDAIALGYGTGATIAFELHTTPGAGTYVVTGVWDDPSNVVQLRTNGVLRSQNTAVPAATINDANYLMSNAGVRFNSDLFEIVVYNRRLPQPQVEAVERYLATKWGVTI